jgi:hypothetical protein
MGELEDEITSILACRGASDFRGFEPGELLTAERLNESFDVVHAALAAQREALLRLAREIDDARAAG